MRYLTVIPARGGSKGIPHKNIFPLDGKPLIVYALEIMQMVKKAGVDMDIVVSTDDQAIMNVVVESGGGVYVVERPESISGDTSSTEDALMHAYKYMTEEFGAEKYDAVITIQPTSPLRTLNTVLECIDTYEKNIDRYDSLLTLTKNDKDFWIKNDVGYERLQKNAARRRQDRKPLYEENGCVYITKTESLIKTGSVLGEAVNGKVINMCEGVDINTYADIRLAEACLAERGTDNEEKRIDNR